MKQGRLFRRNEENSISNAKEQPSDGRWHWAGTVRIRVEDDAQKQKFV